MFRCVIVFATYLESYDHHLAHGLLDLWTPLRVLVLANRAMSFQACDQPKLARRHIILRGIQGPLPLLPVPIDNWPAPVVGVGIAYRPSLNPLQVNLCHPTNFLRVTRLAHLPTTFTFITTFPVTMKAHPTEFLTIIRIALQARHASGLNGLVPQMKWKEWSCLKFIFKVNDKWWRLQGNVENLLLVPAGERGVVSTIIMEVGKL